MMKILLMVVTVFCLVLGQDPCDPNPCGEHTVCLRRTSKIITCKCLPGYVQSANFDGCRVDRETFLENLDPSDYFQDDDEDEQSSTSTTTTATTTTTTTITTTTATSTTTTTSATTTISRPLSTSNNIRANLSPSATLDLDSLPGRNQPNEPRKVAVLGFDESGQTVELLRKVRPNSESNSNNEYESRTRVVSGSGLGHNPFKRPVDLVARNGPINNDNIELLFPEECLINADCLDSHYCDPSDFSCKPACSLPDACGTNTRCKAVRHRPLCLCKSGYVGNPTVACRQQR